MYILGISAFYHDSAACLVHDGEIIAAAQEERFTRKKHDYSFPTLAAQYCLAEAGIGVAELDHVVFYDKPLLKFERLIETWVGYAPLGFRLFVMGLPLWLKQKLHIPREMDRELGGRLRNRYIYTEHHESHAASAFFPSPFEEAAIVTMDGVGEWATASIGHGQGNRIELLREMHFPHSVGLLYSAFTYFCGFRVNSGEYKLMGLAPYGEPRYEQRIREHLIDIKDDGSIRLNMDYFAYCHRDVMTTAKFAQLFDGPPRAMESELTQREMDLAASIQVVTEDIMLRQVRYAANLTGSKNLVLAGGVALNCVGNGRVLREGPFERIWIQPAAGDAGGALGAALFVWYQLLDHPRQASNTVMDAQSGSLLGPAFGNSEIETFLKDVGAIYERVDDERALCERIAQLIVDGNVIGHVSGRMEFGPRALGSRSILGDARSPAMQRTMNLKIKFRESFRPFAPAVLRDRVHEYFEVRDCEDSPYMLLVAAVREEHRLPTNSDAIGLDKLHQLRSDVPAITHVDDSARVQTVHEDRHPRFAGILRAFEAKTGCPVLINTSFNVRGEPIVCTPQDSWRCFMGTNMDVLVLENCVVLKKDQPGGDELRNEEYLAQFALD
jgi:carbamoyltransferase